MSVKIIVVNGRPGCGKTTFEQICQDLQTNVFIISTITFVKKVASFCGWNGQKTLENRKFLSDLKDLLTRWNDIPYKKIQQKVEELDQMHGQQILFVDCREPEEIEKLKQRLGATTLLIRRPNTDNIKTSNHADSEVFNYNYDLTILNDSDIVALKEKAKKFLEKMKEDN